MQKITPFLWYDGQAEEAAKFYTSIFKNSSVDSVNPMMTSFQLNGLQFIALNGGSLFKFSNAVSLFVTCNSFDEIDQLWEHLTDGGTILMGLNEYPWSKKYGWVNDKYGLSWQLYFGDKDQQISPLLLFVQDQFGNAEVAIDLYTSLFDNSEKVAVTRFGEAYPGFESNIQYAEFKLNGQSFMAMESHMEHNFDFNEAFSFFINCENQEEVDFFWNQLIADGGQESKCGWLKDKFGVSWQVVPKLLMQLMSDKDREKANSVMQAMLQMNKIDCENYKKPTMENKTKITVECSVKGTIEKVWDYWTTPKHIEQWNNASDDWHTPKAVNDLLVGGKFCYTMAAKDGSFSFDFGGTYTEVVINKAIKYTMDDGRIASIDFITIGESVEIVETFEAETVNSIELQKDGWQAILNNFKKYTELN